MPLLPQTLLCRYYYDSLDKLTSHRLQGALEIQRFYCKSRLTTEIQGARGFSIVQQGDQLLAEKRSEGGALDTTLLATDLQRSVMQTLKANQERQPFAYSPYGHRPAEKGVTSVLGFNGDPPDTVTGCYLLGNGYRAFNPCLMRFNSPDSWSPFGRGGLNSYEYCKSDPINRTDPNGHFSGMLGPINALASINKQIYRLLNPTKTKIKTTLPGSNNTSPTQKILLNKMPTDIAKEHKFFNDIQKNQPRSLINKISNSKDLSALRTNAEYKFILTNRGELITGAQYPFTSTSGETLYSNSSSHAVLAQFSSSPNVISAGYIHTKNTPLNIKLDNWSGHYAPPKSTLIHAAAFLRGIGAEVEGFPLRRT